jgi:hypothetical protein
MFFQNMLLQWMLSACAIVYQNKQSVCSVGIQRCLAMDVSYSRAQFKTLANVVQLSNIIQYLTSAQGAIEKKEGSCLLTRVAQL